MGRKARKNIITENKIRIIGAILNLFSICGIIFQEGSFAAVSKAGAIYLFGIYYIVFLVALFLFSGYMLIKNALPKLSIIFNKKMIGIYLIIIALLTLASLNFYHKETFEVFMKNHLQIINSSITLMFSNKVYAIKTGGMIGGAFSFLFGMLLSVNGAKIFSYVLIFIGICVITGFSILDFIKNNYNKVKESDLFSKKEEHKEKEVEDKEEKSNKNFMSSISNLFLKEVDEESKPEEQYIVDLKELDQYKTKNDSKVILEDLQKTMELEQIKEEQPDIIVITGDIYYSYRKKIENSLKFLEEISKMYKVYMVTGNHEYRDNNWKEHSRKIKSYGVKIIDNKVDKIYIEDEFIQIYGLKDPSFYEHKVRYAIFEEKLKRLKDDIDEKNLAILLSHRPERFSMYARNNVDLVFTGHAHGGQWQIPFVGGIFSPSQGFFPKYIHGVYEKENTKLVVSQGLGNSSFPIRINNQIELVLVTLKKEAI